MNRNARSLVVAFAVAVSPAGWAENSPIGADAHCHPRRHHLMVMAALGRTDAGGPYSSGGVGYEYRLPFFGDLLGVGGMAELMLKPVPHPMLMAHASVHPFRGLFVATAVGVTHVHGEERSNQAMLRLSTGYDLHMGAFMLTPHVNVDLSRTPRAALSAGLGVGLML